MWATQPQTLVRLHGSLRLFCAYSFIPQIVQMHCCFDDNLWVLSFQQILNYSRNSELGKEFIMHLSNLTIQSTLFVPENDGLENQV